MELIRYCAEIVILLSIVYDGKKITQYKLVREKTEEKTALATYIKRQ